MEPPSVLPGGSTYEKVDYQKSLDENTIVGNQERFKRKLSKQMEKFGERGGVRAAFVPALSPQTHKKLDSPLLSLFVSFYSLQIGVDLLASNPAARNIITMTA